MTTRVIVCPAASENDCCSAAFWLSNRVNLGHKYGSLPMRKSENDWMDVSLKLCEHNNIDFLLMSLNMICILAFHKNVISNSLICLFCSFYERTTFVLKQKHALFFRSFDNIKVYCLKMYLYAFLKYTFFGSTIF